MNVVELHDSATGCRARISVDRGFNCFEFAAIAGGRPHELLWSAPEFAAGQGRPSGSGIPLLFPFAGRIRGTSFVWQGKKFSLTAGDSLGNAIHGFVLDRPWRVIEQSPTRAAAEFHAARDDALLLNHWPGDFRIVASYELQSPAVLASQIRIENPGDRPLPFWFGTHPYFRVPLVDGRSAGECRVTVPAGAYWELADMLPTGRQLPATGERDLAGGLPFERTHLDDVFTWLKSQHDEIITRIDDPQGGRALVMSFDATFFRECVVYNPPHRQAICLEPYSAVPDAFTLAERGIETGLAVLAPGESRQTWISIRLE